MNSGIFLLFIKGMLTGILGDLLDFKDLECIALL